MKLPETNKTYINWKDYILFRKIFESLQISTQISEDIISFIVQNPVHVCVERNKFINICQIIRELFNIMSSNDSCKNGKCCNYINYYIREQIKQFFPLKVNDIFEHFKKYVESKKTNESYKTCMPEIKYIEEQEFDKMNELYQLYEYYESILNPDSEDNNDPNDCTELKEFIDEYNEIIGKHKEDIHFHKELNNLRCSIENNDLYNNCKSELRQISKNVIIQRDKNNCNAFVEKQYLKEYSEKNNTYFSASTYIPHANMNVIIPTTLSSVFLGIVLYIIYKFTASRNYLRNRFLRMREMNRNIIDETYQHEMCNKKHYHGALKEKCYNVSYVSERKY
ncbi:variable surface protein [Plasmodium gonderi]|uniref:Variable surface protein n=1 Tax=Plasmodium gonderi TaxID=77519 RepID=A0A1Y1JT53_PLAGO|nr:variable surface protein [Plasmodium gonderi]GAW84618.1 variable surface protein [Plasmodium gonderi]